MILSAVTYEWDLWSSNRTSNTGLVIVRQTDSDQYTSVWGTMCYQGLTYTTADVICRFLGYDIAASWRKISELANPDK